MNRITVFLFLSFALQTMAQNISFDYGDISEFEKNYAQVPYDTGAPVVVFFSKKDISYETGKYGFAQVVHESFRAKVLKTEGTNLYSHLKLKYYRDYEFKEFRVQSINFEEGQCLKNEKTQTDGFISKEKDQVLLNTIVLEKVKVGTIIEYSIIYHTYPERIYDFYFQDVVPVLHAEVNAKIPSFFFFRTFIQNCDSTYEASTSEYKQYMDLIYFDLYTTEGLVLVKGLNYHLQKKNNPAFSTESLTSTYNDYMQKVIFQLTATHYPGRDIKHKMTTWNDLHQNILEHKNIYKKIDKTHSSKQIVEKLKLDSLKPEQKLSIIFNYVQENTQWGENHSVYAENEIDDIMTKDLNGSTADINIALIRLLRIAGLEANPVLISTRSNGKPYKDYPVADQFNSIIAMVEIQNKPWLLDAHLKTQSIYSLPVEDLNYEGYLVKEDTAYWIPLIDNTPSMIQGVIDYKVNNNFSEINVDIRINCFGQAASNWYNNHSKEEEDFYKQKFNALNPNLTLQQISVTPGELSPLEVNAKLSMDQQADAEFVYFTPNLFLFIDPAFVNQHNRKYPVEIPYAQDYNLNYSIEIPEGYSVAQLPKPIRLSLPNKEGLFAFQSMQQGNKILLSYRIDQERTFFPVEKFESLKQYFLQIFEKQNLQLVFEKK